MLPRKFFGAILAAAVVALSASYAGAQEFEAQLSGFNELGTINAQTGAILSNATGTAKLELDQKGQTITYTLTYSNVGTTAPLTGTVTQAHIHFGKSRDSGGILVFFCSNLGNGPAGTPTCPANSGTVTGMWTPASIVAIATQNVAAGNFNALVDALLSHTAYANVHQTALTAGEIRGQVFPVEREHHHGQGNDQGNGQGH
jgi:hypothetical protein